MATPAAQRWSSVLDDAAESDLSLRAFARSRGLNPNTLAWWKWRLGRSTGTSTRTGFLEVVSSEPQANTLCVEVGSARMEVDSDSDLDLLRRVVEALS